MNKRFFFTLMTVSFLMAGTSLFGQFKSIKFGQTPKNKIIKLEIPDGKIIRGTAKASSFVPRSVSFHANSDFARVTTDQNTNLPIFIEGTTPVEGFTRSRISTMVFDFLAKAGPMLAIEDAPQEFEVGTIEEDDLGYTHVRIEQVYKGIPVFGGEMIFHIKNKELPLLNGRTHPTPKDIDIEPGLSVEESQNLVISDLGGIQRIDFDKFHLFDQDPIQTEMVIYYENKHPHLAYHTVAYKNLIDRWEYFVDAHTGEIIDKYKSMCTFHADLSDLSGDFASHHINTGCAAPVPPVLSNATNLFGNNIQINTYEINGKYYLIDASKDMYDQATSNLPDEPVGAVWTIDAFNTSPQNNNFNYDHVKSNTSSFSGQETAVSAHYNGGQAYLYYKNRHNRQSINGEGGNIVSLINIADEDGSSLGNAFWNGVAIFYGNGGSQFKPLAKGLDVAGHEMSHGVIQSTANLTYQGESGALNESFADVFGSMIDRDDWLIGEDVVNPEYFPSGALRSMKDPHNGASTGQVQNGWQPRVYSEKYTGTQDNGGVHINSGIPNWAFYKFATSSSVGKDKAEKVYYRALTKYLTKSSQFIDCRLAVVKAANDLYGSSVADAAKAAFDAVEIFNGQGTNNQTDVEANPGADLILFTTADQNNLYIADKNGNLIFDPLTEQDPISVPSITDDGSEIVFVNSDKDLYYIRINWATQTVEEQGVIGANGQKFRNVILSKDGMRLAALTDAQDNTIFVYDYGTGAGNTYELFNPTFTEGVSTGDVLYADAMEFDFAGEYIMYDAFNRIQSQFGSDINWWDIGFIKVFDNENNSFTLGQDIEKLFSQLPEGVSIGNPVFSKNSEYIIAFDILQDGGYAIRGANIESGTVKEIFQNDRLGYPSYANNDGRLIFDAYSNQGVEVIGGVDLKSNKIEGQPNTASIQLGYDIGVKWGVWFGNGERDISADDDIRDLPYKIYPNPSSGNITIQLGAYPSSNTVLKIHDLMGREVYRGEMSSQKKNIDLGPLPAGQYVVTVIQGEYLKSHLISIQ